MIEPPIVPSLSIPKPPDLPAPVLEIPKAELPSYRPVFISPAASADTLPVQVEIPAQARQSCCCC